MDKMLHEALHRYFNALVKLGYMSKNNQDKLLVLIFVYELLERLIKDSSIIVTQEEYRMISEALTHLYGSSCLIPYPEYKKEAQIVCCDCSYYNLT